MEPPSAGFSTTWGRGSCSLRSSTGSELEPQRHKGHKERPHQESLFVAFLCALCVFVVLIYLAEGAPLLCRRRRLTIGAWSRPAHKHFFPVKIFHKNADALTLSTLGLVCEDLDLRSDR